LAHRLGAAGELDDRRHLSAGRLGSGCGSDLYDRRQPAAFREIARPDRRRHREKLERELTRSPFMIGRRPTRSGMSLLEVLIALAIFLFSLVGIGQLISYSGQSALE